MSKQSLERADADLGFPIIDILDTKLADTGPQHRKEVGSAVTGLSGWCPRPANRRGVSEEL
jgi:hypothetical protein